MARLRKAPELDDQMVSIQEAAALVGCSTKTIHRRIADGTLRAYRFGPRSVRLNVSDLTSLYQVIA